MVKRGFFARMGIVRFVRGWLRRRRFISALNESEQLYRSGKGKHIVVCLDGEPLVISKKRFKEMRRKHIFKDISTWGLLCRWQITRQNLDEFFTANTER